MRITFVHIRNDQNVYENTTEQHALIAHMQTFFLEILIHCALKVPYISVLIFFAAGSAPSKLVMYIV